MHTFGKDFSTQSINSNVEDLNRLIFQQNYEIPISYPIIVKNAEISGDGNITQMFMHWSKHSHSRRHALLNYKIDQTEKIQDIVRTPWGLATSLVVDKYSSKLDGSDLTQIVRDARNRALKNTENRFNLSNNLKGPVHAFLCADHLNYYSNVLCLDREPRSEDSFVSLIKKLYEFHLPRATPTHPQLNSLGKVLKELFDNTHQHARQYREIGPVEQTKSTKRRIGRSVRGIFARLVPFGKIDLFNMEDEFAQSLRTYLLNLKGAPDKKRKAMVFSVFDCGPGYAATVLDTEYNLQNQRQRKISFEVELEITKSCFIRNVTSKQGVGYGEGLTECLLALKELRGLFVLRTGRVNLYIDPSHFREDDATSISKCINRYHDGESKEYAPISGTSITVIVPA